MRILEDMARAIGMAGDEDCVVNKPPHDKSKASQYWKPEAQAALNVIISLLREPSQGMYEAYASGGGCDLNPTGLRAIADYLERE